MINVPMRITDFHIELNTIKQTACDKGYEEKIIDTQGIKTIIQ